VYNAGLTDERRQVFIMSTRSNSGLAGRIFEYSLPNSTAVYKMDYDDHGNLIRITDPIGRKIEYRYDTDGDRREILAYKDATTYDLTTIDHNAFGQQTFIQEPAGAITRSTYNATTGALETLVREVSGASQTTRLSYDPVTIKGTAVQAGLVTKVTLPDGTVHTQSYDSLGYPATTTYDAGSGRLNLTEQSSYDWRGFLISQTNLQGITTSYEYATSAGHYGNVGWPSAEVFDSASGGRAIRTEYSYNALGHMTRQVIDAGAAPRLNATWAYEYRPVGTEGGYSVTRVTDPLNQVVAYDYTSYGELKQIVEASQNNRTTRFEYHPQGWLWKRRSFTTMSGSPARSAMRAASRSSTPTTARAASKPPGSAPRRSARLPRSMRSTPTATMPTIASRACKIRSTTSMCSVSTTATIGWPGKRTRSVIRPAMATTPTATG
jgi:YD repeat-containing protein